LEVTSLYREPAQPVHGLEWPALECIDVFKIFRSGGVETVALRGFDLRIERGEFVAVLGRSGSGKSTFVRLSAGLDEASAGEVRAFGRSLGRMRERELAAYRANVIALVMQSDNLWSDLTARENVLASLRIAGVEEASRRADDALDAFGLGARAQHRPSALSGGEQQRVAIAAAASRQAPIVLADEPTGELDAGNEQIVLDALQQLRDMTGATIVTVTHSRSVAERADRIVAFVDGRVEES
jgi:putative ABC transport system ATP-binding protein